MIIPARVEFQQTALSLSDKDLEALVDTGSEMEALAGFQLFDKGALEDAQRPVALIGAGKSCIEGGNQGVTVNLTLPVCKTDGSIVKYKCLRVFIYVAELPHQPSPDRLRLAGGGRGMGNGHRPRRPWRRVGGFLPSRRGPNPGATVRLMAAYLTWRGIPPPRSLQSLVQRAQQPHIPPPQPGTYGNAAVARMTARGTRLDGTSNSPRRTTATVTTLSPRSRATTATRATNVRAQTSAATSSASPSTSTSAPPTPVTAPHQQHATDTTRTTSDPAPSRAGTPQSP